MELRDQLQTTLGDAYTLERELTGGGMSRVFVAEERALGRKVVVKVLPPTLAGAVNIERFKREIQVAARLQHAHIVPVLAAGETNGMPFYTMPFVDGESLRGRLVRGGALPLTEAISIMRDVSRALAYAHDRGIVHRDIKPDNVMISGGSAVVTDFGIAKAISASRTQDGAATLTQIGTSLGTPAYMAPEQAAADPATDHRADLYAFGCMAYEMLAGTPPFVEKSPQQLLAAHMAKTPEPIAARRPDVPPVLAALVMKCLEKDAAARQSGAAEIVNTLETVTSGGTHQAMPPILLGSSGSLRRALLAWVAAFAAVLVLAKAAIVGIGLPDWVFPGAIGVMLLGLPVILFTAYVQRVTRHALTSTPTYTPGGTPSMGAHGTLANMAMKASPHMTWRRTAMGGVWAVGVFAVLVAVFMVLRLTGIGPAASLLSSGKLSDTDRILVADFKATGPDSALSGVLAEALRSSLSQSKRMRVLQSSEIVGALQRMQRPASSKVDVALAQEIAQREGVKAIATGEITAVSGGYLVTTRLIAAATGDVLASFQQSANGAADLIPAMDKLGRQLRGKIGESLRDVQGAPPLAKVRTASLEALRKFSEGARKNDIENEPEKAVPLLDEAIALDSNFAMAYRKLAIALGTTGQGARAAQVVEKAYPLRDNMPEAERLALLGVYYSYGAHPDRAKMIDSYEQLFAKYPEWLTIITPDLLAGAYESRGEYARAESTWAQIVRNTPDESSPHYDLVRSQIQQGKYARARENIVAARATKNAATIRAVERYFGHLLYGEGQLDSAFAVFQKNAHVTDPLFGEPFRRGASADLGNLALLRGNVSEAARRFGDASGDPKFATNTATPGAIMVAVRVFQNPDEGRRRMDAFLARRAQSTAPSGPMQPLNDAVLEAQVGRPARARTLIEKFDAQVTDTARVREAQSLRHRALGWLAIAEGRNADALREFRASTLLPDGPRNSCARCDDPQVGLAFDRANMADSAIATYEHFVKTPDAFKLNSDAPDLPWILRRLGELYEAKGDATKAREHYQHFVDLWSGADPELQPKVADVRARLRRLAESTRRAQ